jgi:hypothetical protein
MDGQSPPWLIESDSIKIIYHSEIISAEFLPTFCSTVIESSLHKIPGLAEHFVYNNDDCLFWGKVDSSTFMNDRDPIIHLNDVVSQSGEILPSDSGHIAGIKNANKLLDRKFGQKSRKECHHFSQLMTKSACELAWNYFESDILRSLVNKFRSANSIAFTNHLVPHLMIELDQARFSSCGTKGVGISFRSFRILNHIVNALKYGGQRGEDRAMATLASIPDLTFLVIDGDATTVSKILNNWFAEPSEFEKS